MESSGEDFVNLLKDLNCPGATGLQGEDVDWLWETSAQNLMKWICSNITPTNCLTAEEAKRWKNFPEEDILRGDKLQEALDDIIDDDNEQHKNLDETKSCFFKHNDAAVMLHRNVTNQSRKYCFHT